jgi:hypothetical protein
MGRRELIWGSRSLLRRTRRALTSPSSRVTSAVMTSPSVMPADGDMRYGLPHSSQGSPIRGRVYVYY